ncbi:hypothetical protein DJ017_18835 [Phenylobacterium soli]|uniref:Uncharacterized protein n=1 Tax=Phenylobacterium soli TaxID=2170551 RepID=A0A328AB64_9CAUL|nr:hypothetical protein DJ017_18835 [Phenylobacterium soli]
MTRDFGDASSGRDAPVSRIRRLGGAVAPFLFFGLFATLPTLTAVSGMNPDPRPRAVEGEPCRTISKAEFLRGWREPARSFRYHGARFERRRGDADCGVGHDGLFGRGYPACTFSAPVALGVVIGRQEAYFAVGPGYTAVIEARPGHVRCVVLGAHRL